MNKIFLFLGFLIVRTLALNAQVPYWQQMGIDMDGDTAYAAAGYSVAMSADGLTIAEGGPGTSFPYAGHVTVREWNGVSWTQKGNTFYGMAFDQSGAAVSLSDNGSRLAICNEGNHTRVFEWNGNTWVQMGGNIPGIEPRGVSLNSAGTVVAIGNAEGGANYQGSVSVYNWNGSGWIQKGAEVMGGYYGVEFHYVSVSGDGNRVIIGDPDDEIGPNAPGAYGFVKVLHWNGPGWEVKASFYGQTLGAFQGASVAISNDGNTIAIGSVGASQNQVRMYRWDGSNWLQAGAAILGEDPNEGCGSGVSLSSDGNRVAIGSSLNDGNGSNSGHVRIFDWDGSGWLQIGQAIPGEYADDYLGGVLAISNDGSRLVMGAFMNDAGGIDAGHVRVFQLITPPPCLANVVITGNPYTIPYTESSNWIETNGYVIVPTNTYVNLDADSTSYVKLYPGFKAEYGSVFIAEPFNGCSIGAPLLPMQKSSGIEEQIIEANIGLKIYPNPTNGIITIEHNEQRHEIVIYNLKGTKLMSINSEGKANSQFDLSNFAKGIYVIRVDGFKSVKVIRD